MKPSLLFLFCLLVWSLPMAAQTDTLAQAERVEVENVEPSASVLAPYYQVATLSSGWFATRKYDNRERFLPSLSFGYEWVPWRDLWNGKADFGLGAYWGAASSVHDESDGVTHYYTTDILFCARGFFHYELLPSCDTYVGLSAGLRSNANLIKTVTDSFTSRSYEEDTLHLYADCFAGIRYFVLPRIGINLEVGYLLTICNLGVSFLL